MSIFFCNHCLENIDSDFVDSYADPMYEDEMVCKGCYEKIDKVVRDVPPEGVADHYYQGGDLLSANPYPSNSPYYIRFRNRMGKRMRVELERSYRRTA